MHPEPQVERRSRRVIGDFAWIEPGTTLGEAVRIGARTAVGIGATGEHGVTIGVDTVLGVYTVLGGTAMRMVTCRRVW